MIKKYVYGDPFFTDAVVKDIEKSEDKLPYFDVKDGVFTYALSEDDIVYGLGEQIRGINKRGWQYVSWNYDNPNHHEDTRSLYGSHNFIIICGKQTFGAFFDYAGRMEFDIGYTKRSLMQIKPEKNDIAVYIITGENEKDIVKQFRQLIGRSYIPPFWAFGYGQSRWGYRNEQDIRTVAEKYKEAGVPLDSIYLDIDYMERYKDFTVDKERFPDLKKLSDDMKLQGIHLVPIIDAGVKIEDGYDVYEEGVKNNYFCKNAEGKDFVGAVWPGRVHFPDFLQPEARDWFGRKYAALTDLGIEGFWNDMNEPALFYSPERLKAFFENAAALSRKDNLDQNDFFGLVRSVMGLMNAPEDYRSFYHDTAAGRVRHDRVHNLYGGCMTRAAGEAFQTLRPGQRTLLYCRSSIIGAHRWGGIWLGDNHSSWSQLLANIQMMPAVQMCGFLYSGADLCGFSEDTTPDLVLRWLEFGLFTPLMRNHADTESREQEFYRFTDVLPAIRNMLDLRYALLPYLYSEFMKAALEDTPYFRPLAFDYPADPDAREVDDQLLLGESLMVAPVHTQNAHGRTVYLPETMKMLRLRSVSDYDEEVLPAGRHYLLCELDEVLLFIRPGHTVPVAQPAANTAQLDDTTLTFWRFAPDGQPAPYRMYTDDGVTTDHNKPEHWRIVGQ